MTSSLSLAKTFDLVYFTTSRVFYVFQRVKILRFFLRILTLVFMVILAGYVRVKEYSEVLKLGPCRV